MHRNTHTHTHTPPHTHCYLPCIGNTKMDAWCDVIDKIMASGVLTQYDNRNRAKQERRKHRCPSSLGECL